MDNTSFIAEAIETTQVDLYRRLSNLEGLVKMLEKDVTLIGDTAYAALKDAEHVHYIERDNLRDTIACTGADLNGEMGPSEIFDLFHDHLGGYIEFSTMPQVGNFTLPGEFLADVAHHFGDYDAEVVAEQMGVDCWGAIAEWEVARRDAVGEAQGDFAQ